MTVPHYRLPQWTDYAALVLVIAALASVLIPRRAAAQTGKADS